MEQHLPESWHLQKSRDRSFRRGVFKLVVLVVASWVVMTFTHEAGHVIGGWIGGATLTDFDLVPWHLPYSVHQPDPHPLLTLWSGPVLGVAIPGLIALVFRHQWVVFVADFCLLANGGYLVLAWIAGDRLLDTPRLLDAGASPVVIALFCIFATGIGYVRFRRDCIEILSEVRVDANDATRNESGSGTC